MPEPTSSTSSYALGTLCPTRDVTSCAHARIVAKILPGFSVRRKTELSKCPSRIQLLRFPVIGQLCTNIHNLTLVTDHALKSLAALGRLNARRPCKEKRRTQFSMHLPSRKGHS